MPAKALHSSRILARSLPKGPSVGEVGAGAMRLEPVAVQREMWRLLEAVRSPVSAGMPLHESAVIEVPRRSGKTEGLFSLAVGRCLSRPGYVAVYCAQSGIKSRARFLSLARRLGAGPWSTYRARGEEAVNFENGSALLFYPPKADSFRGDAIDLVIFDEAQEVDEEDAAELVGSVLPVFDTRPGAQLVVAGTAGGVRSGLLWDALQKGRAGRWGILEYAAPEGIDVSDERVWLRTHPGPAGVSKAQALAVLRKRYEEMSAVMFAREYLGVWPDVSASSAFSSQVWEAAGAEQPARPERFGLAFDVTPSGDRASVCAVWRDQDGLTWAEVLRDEAGSRWVPEFVAGLSLRHRTPVAYDTSGIETLNVADEVARRFPKATLKGLTTVQFAASCAALSGQVLAGSFRHSRQPALTQAVENASRRDIRDGGWAWGRKVSSGSIAALVSVTVALRAYEELPAARRLQVLTART